MTMVSAAFPLRRQASRVARAVMPMPIWNAYLRARGLGEHQSHPWRTFGFMATRADANALFTGRFSELYEKFGCIDPTMDPEISRYRNYCNCLFAYRCRCVPGDFVCGGISYGVSAKMIFEFSGLYELGKTLHLIDPFDGEAGDGRRAGNYNCDPQFVRRQYPDDAKIVIHRDRIPIDLSRPLAFVMTATGVPGAEFSSIPVFYKSLSPGGILLSGAYRDDIAGAIPMWMPSGVTAYFKPLTAETI